jgi:hypothetical protein
MEPIFCFSRKKKKSNGSCNYQDKESKADCFQDAQRKYKLAMGC